MTADLLLRTAGFVVRLMGARLPEEGAAAPANRLRVLSCLMGFTVAGAGWERTAGAALAPAHAADAAWLPIGADP